MRLRLVAALAAALLLCACESDTTAPGPVEQQASPVDTVAAWMPVSFDDVVKLLCAAGLTGILPVSVLLYFLLTKGDR